MKFFNTACLTLVALLVKAAIAVPVPPQPGGARLAVHHDEPSEASGVPTQAAPLILKGPGRPRRAPSNRGTSKEQGMKAQASGATWHRTALDEHWLHHAPTDAYAQAKVDYHKQWVAHHDENSKDLPNYPHGYAARNGAYASIINAQKSIEESKTHRILVYEAKSAHKLAAAEHRTAGENFWRNHAHTDSHAQEWVDHHKKWAEHHDKNAEDPFKDYATATDSRNAAQDSMKDAQKSIENAKSYSSTRVHLFHTAVDAVKKIHPDGHMH